MKHINFLSFLSICFLVSNVSAQEVNVKNLSIINSEALEFSPVPYGNGLVFTSTRDKSSILKCPPSDKTHFADLYYAEKDEAGNFKEPSIMRGSVNAKYHDGVPTFSKDGSQMIFSRSNMEGKNKKDTIDRKIYTLSKVGDKWQNIVEFPYNNDYFSTCHPTLSPDGERLYFSSNRPGGHGGMDLYMSNLVNGEWGPPINMGPNVNSKGNEIFPFADGNGNLFYSTDGQGGSGGLDIFIARDFGGNWEMLTNLGAPFNSAADDLGYTANDEGTEGFFASSRGGGEGGDDIYHWTFEPEEIEAVIVVVDADTGERLKNVPVTIKPIAPCNTLYLIYGDGGSKEKMVATSTEGSVDYKVCPQGTYDIEVNAPGYLPVQLQPTTYDLTKEPEFIIPVKREKVVAKLDGLVVNKNNNNPIPMADVEIIDEETGEKLDLTADGEGSFTTEIDCKHKYKITASKRGFSTESLSLTDLLKECDPNKPVSRTIKLTPAMVITLEGVYYDFDKATLRPEGKEALDKVVTFMREYASLEILLAAHTDCRGSNAYNIDLSNRRAKSCMDYLISKGVNANRLDSKGYGETKLINKCSDGVPCTKEEHQANRRTEMEVTKFEEDGVEFKN